MAFLGIYLTEFTEVNVLLRNCLMTAVWVPEEHKAEVMLKNKNWEVFGHHSDDTDWLFPEEALYLMEMVSQFFSQEAYL